MNREIKFRVWDGEKMIYESLQGEYDDYYMLNLQGEFFRHTRTGDEYFNYEADDVNKKQFILMQYTGLKDKNGKEIYEGDILKFRSHPEKMKIGNVYYEPNWARFLIKSQDEFEKSKSTFSVKSFGALNHKEVIGNIFQNPEILK